MINGLQTGITETGLPISSRYLYVVGGVTQPIFLHKALANQSVYKNKKHHK